MSGRGKVYLRRWLLRFLPLLLLRLLLFGLLLLLRLGERLDLRRPRKGSSCIAFMSEGNHIF